MALVTGASRGGGRGIVLALGEQGATVYVTGRSVRGEPTTLGRPGTVEDTARSVRSSLASAPGTGGSTSSSTTPGAGTSSRPTPRWRSGRSSGGTGT